jgi:hypothetical protein
MAYRHLRNENSSEKPGNCHCQEEGDNWEAANAETKTVQQAASFDFLIINESHKSIDDKS